MVKLQKNVTTVNEHTLLEMIDMYLAGKLTPDQQVELNQWYASFENKKGLFEENSPAMRKLAVQKLSELTTKLFDVEFEASEHSTVS